MLNALLVMIGLAVALGLVLGFASLKFKVEGNPLVEKVDAILPQIQCGQCGYPGCKPYAEAISAGNTAINLCAPGGEATMLRLADLLGVDPQPLAADAALPKPKQVALIDEQTCIGCTLCLQACPVDAILGAAKQMHTIIASECTGCELCLPPCPVDCITMEPVDEGMSGWKWKYPTYPISEVEKDAEVTA